ncbi:hypothetical protein ANCCAN_22487 [Ancylostoma caninum]|uniref:Uncharacterized protein n=1 Tax=Ancylostoma caninum TaxID=29170 RepID=A0A368FHU3_ANCCA|nr:hypothetical protein ANCCAN_22487 [Ancylostoma caninum]
MRDNNYGTGTTTVNRKKFNTSKTYELSDIGVPGYKCDMELMKPSKTVPTNVNSVRPADIKVVMALGDSLTVCFL